MCPNPMKRAPRQLIQMQLVNINNILAAATKGKAKGTANHKGTGPATASNEQPTPDSMQTVSGALGELVQAGIRLDGPINSDGGAHGAVKNEVNDKDDPAILEQAKHASLQRLGLLEVNVSKQTSVDTKYNVGSSPRAPLPLEETAPQKTMVELSRNESSSAIVNENDPKQLMAEVVRICRFCTALSISFDEGNEYLDKLRANMASLVSHIHENTASTTHERDNVYQSPEALDRQDAKHRLAPQLGHGNSTQSLFSDGVDNFEAEQEKQAYIKKCEDDLQRQIEDCLDDTSLHCVVEEKTRLPCRIVVTNIATDAKENDLALVFREFDIRNITLLKERHPTNDTRAAYVDFYNKQSAREAAHVLQYIFGLKLRVRLAIDVL